MIATSFDGQWATVRRGRDVVLLAAGAGPGVGRIELESDDVDLTFVGPPTVLCAISRAPEPKVVLHAPPYLDAAARHDLDRPMKLAAVTGPRMILVSVDGKKVSVVRSAGRGLAAQPLEVGGPVEFAVGLERNQVLFGLSRKLEVWDAVSSRPLLRLQLQLPPPPRTIGAAQGHLWVTRPGSDEVFIYRLSDGRPFRHYVGAPVDEVISHAASPMIVLATPRGLVRLHCFAHSLSLIDSPWTPGMALAQLAVGDDISLLGLGADGDEPWRVPIGGAGAPLSSGDAAEPTEPAADRPRATREQVAVAAADHAGSAASSIHTPSHAPPVTHAAARARMWRDPLAGYGVEIARGLDAELPAVPVDSELGELAHRLALPVPARRALIALYALHLGGDPGVSIARLAHVLGDWTEPLGQGDLHALGMLRRRHGRIGLRATVTDLLDGTPARAIRVVGGAARAPRAGAVRIARDGRSDAVIETELAGKLGRIAVLHGGARRGVLEARLQGATAVAFVAPAAPPTPWPRDAGLVVVADADAPAWVAALSPLT